MSLSSGIPIGVLITIVGGILFYTTKHKKIAKIIFGIGIGVSLLAIGIIVLAVNSSM